MARQVVIRHGRNNLLWRNPAWNLMWLSNLDPCLRFFRLFDSTSPRVSTSAVLNSCPAMPIPVLGTTNCGTAMAISITRCCASRQGAADPPYDGARGLF